MLVQAVYNKGDPANPKHPGDTNPKKVPLRDIMVSIWQQKTGRSISELSKFKYWEVLESTTVAAVPKAYKAMGKTLDDNEKTAGFLLVTRTGKANGESEAYKIMRKSQKLCFYVNICQPWGKEHQPWRDIPTNKKMNTGDTTFSHGIKKLTQEYAEYNKKHIEAFIITWDYGTMDLLIELIL